MLALEAAIASLQAIVAEECQTASDHLVSMSQVALRFYSKHQIGLTKLSSHYHYGGKIRNFFASHPTVFKIHDQPSGPCLELVNTDNLASSSKLPLPQSTEELSQILTALVRKSLTSSQPELELNKLCNLFYQSYGEPITATLKRLKVGKKLVTFLRDTTQFTVRQQNKQSFVSLS